MEIEVFAILKIGGRPPHRKALSPEFLSASLFARTDSSACDSLASMMRAAQLILLVWLGLWAAFIAGHLSCFAYNFEKAYIGRDWMLGVSLFYIAINIAILGWLQKRQNEIIDSKKQRKTLVAAVVVVAIIVGCFFYSPCTHELPRKVLPARRN